MIGEYFTKILYMSNNLIELIYPIIYTYNYTSTYTHTHMVYMISIKKQYY